jgi:hypothetical protein
MGRGRAFGLPLTAAVWRRPHRVLLGGSLFSVARFLFPEACVKCAVVGVTRVTSASPADGACSRTGAWRVSATLASPLI